MGSTGLRAFRIRSLGFGLGFRVRIGFWFTVQVLDQDFVHGAAVQDLV